jgi:cytochrome c oxidase subunit II
VRLTAALLLFSIALAGCSREEAATAAQTGRKIAEAKGCQSCHSVDGTKSIAPTWKGLYGSRVELTDGTTVVANQTYLRQSMLDPSAKTVKGFKEGLMETVIKSSSLSEPEVRALIAYIKTLR